MFSKLINLIFEYNQTKNSKKMKKIFKNLTKDQKKTFYSLVKLGDSEELALKTVLNKKQRDDNSFYELAYYS